MNPSTPNPFDQAARYLLRAGDLLPWLLCILPGAIHFVRWLDTRLTAPGQSERYCDTIAHVQRLDQGGLPWAIPVEFQAAPDALMFGRIQVYEGMVWILEKPTEHVGDRFQLQSVVVNLTGFGQPGRRLPWLVGDPTVTSPIVWNFEMLDAAVILDQIDAAEAPRYLLPFIPLMQRGGEDDIIRRWLQIADRESDPYRRADFALAVVFAELAGCRDGWKKALEGFNVIESVTVNEWKAKVRVEDIIGFLQARFGALPADAREKIEATIALDTLGNWVALAGEAKSLDDFRLKAGV